MEIRFSYNPDHNDFIDCPTCHSTALYNKGKQKDFDKYIRGILLDGILYLRLFYPYDNIEELNIVQLQKHSRELLSFYLRDILKKIKEHYEIIPEKIVYNAVNDLLKGILTNI